MDTPLPLMPYELRTLSGQCSDNFAPKDQRTGTTDGLAAVHHERQCACALQRVASSACNRSCSLPPQSLICVREVTTSCRRQETLV